MNQPEGVVGLLAVVHIKPGVPDDVDAVDLNFVDDGLVVIVKAHQVCTALAILIVLNKYRSSSSFCFNAVADSNDLAADLLGRAAREVANRIHDEW